jgi:UDP-galactopyranose mutase
MYDWIIVGAGYTGSVMAERLATQLDQTVLVVDRRDHIGGNAFDHVDESGILIHKYGPHIFHTNSQRVWEYLSAFTDWRKYSHKVLAEVDGQRVPVPFNLTSLRMLFSPDRAARLQRLLVGQYGMDTKVPVLRMRKDATGELRELADFIYEKVFYNYTVKQWGLTPDQLSPSVTARVPIHISFDDRYFQDTYQAMPLEGYTAMFRRMLAHRNITVMLGADYRQLGSSIAWKRMLYTGPIDTYFGDMHGTLPYRSLRFDSQTLQKERFQPVGQLNYPNEHEFTRITEFKHMTGQIADHTSIMREYPQEHIPGKTEALYPIPRDECRAQYALYEEEARKLDGSVIFAGRLADYQYYNMDQVVGRALSVFEQEVARDTERVRRLGDAQPRPVAA